MRFLKDGDGNIRCECGCKKFYPLETLDIFNDKIMSTYCIEKEQERMYQDRSDRMNYKWGGSL